MPYFAETQPKKLPDDLGRVWGRGEIVLYGSLVLLKGVTATYPRVTLRTNIPDLGSMPGSVPSHPQRKKTKIKQVLAFER